MAKATCTDTTNRPGLPVPIDLDVELRAMSDIHVLLATLDYEARVRVLAWLARRFDVDTDALRL